MIHEAQITEWKTAAYKSKDRADKVYQILQDVFAVLDKEIQNATFSREVRQKSDRKS